VVVDEWGKLVMLDELGLLGFSAWCGVEGGRWCSFIAVQGRFKLGDKEYIDAVLWFMLTVAGWTRFNCDVGESRGGAWATCSTADSLRRAAMALLDVDTTTPERLGRF
jgi:hypothetical protein